MIDGPFSQGDLNLIVADFQRYETWNWEAASFTLRKAIKDKIRAIPIQSCGERRDTIMWKYFKDGEFTAKLAYLLARQEGNSGDHSKELGFGNWKSYQRALISYDYASIAMSMCMMCLL